MSKFKPKRVCVFRWADCNENLHDSYEAAMRINVGTEIHKLADEQLFLRGGEYDDVVEFILNNRGKLSALLREIEEEPTS